MSLWPGWEIQQDPCLEKQQLDLQQIITIYLHYHFLRKQVGSVVIQRLQFNT